MNAARILLVEDNPMNTRLFRKILEFRGHQVVCATTVDEGKSRLREAVPDLVLLDVQIPGGGGERLLGHIRADVALAALPVIAVTALAMQGDRQRLLDAGFDSYISKPIDTRQFGVQVEAMLKPRGAAEPAPPQRNILMIEDDASFRALIVPLLQRNGFVVVEAATGEEADAAVAKLMPDLVIVDYHLPDTTGTSWVARLRSRGLRTKVMLVSSFWRDLKSLRELIHELEIAQVLKKPVIPAVLVELVESLVGTTPTTFEVVELDVQLAAMRGAYAAELPLLIEQLSDALRRAIALPTAAPLLATAKAQLHKLLGTAGSYGFFELGDVLARLEGIVRQGGETLSPGAGSEIEAAIAAMARAMVANDRGGHAVIHSPGRVLVVDGDPESLRFLVSVGRKQLWDVVAAASAPEALELARSSPPDAAIIDVSLGADSGFELARGLRGLPSCEVLPVAFIPTHDTFAHRVEAAHLGASMYLPRPIEASVLVATVDQLLSLKKAGLPRILVIDDDERFGNLMRTVLEGGGMTVSSLADSTRVLEVLEEQRPELILLDMAMPGVSGFDICRILRSTPTWRDLPIVFVSARAEVATRVAGFKAGGDDFLSKPIVAEELLARVGNLVQRSRLLRERAERDALTGLLLRRAFLERVSARLTEARRRSRPLAVGLIDLDHFKKINDVRGHMIGDRVLASIGKLLGRRFRPADLRARWGGEEFILAFPDEDAETIDGVLTRFLAEFSSMTFDDDAGGSFRVTFSAGVASFPDDGAGLEDVIRIADHRLYVAKTLGRNRVVGPDPA